MEQRPCPFGIEQEVFCEKHDGNLLSFVSAAVCGGQPFFGRPETGFFSLSSARVQGP